MSAPSLPAEWGVRILHLAEADGYLDGPDVDLAYEVIRRVEDGLLSEPDSTRESIRHQLTSPEAAIEEHRLILDGSGRPAGLLLVEIDRVGRRIFIEPYAPDDDLLPAIVDLGLQAADRLCGGVPGWEVETGAYAADTAFRAALAAAGFVEVRRFWKMRIDFTEEVTEPTPPAGVTRTVAESEADRRVLHSIFESSFAEHFGSVPNRYEDWLGWFLARRDALPQTWWLAWLDGDPVGGIAQDDSRADRGLGYIRTLGVLASVRGRGIGSWLLQAAFADAARRGLRGVSLGVDSENASGAADLYIRNGMHAEETIDAFRRPTG